MTAKRRTITLTDRAPVRIVESEWPVVSVARDDAAGWAVRVRRHADGRVIVYGSRGVAREGELLASVSASDAVADAILRVGALCGAPGSAIAQCIANLPAEEL